MKRLLTIVLSAIFLFPLSADAQSLTNKERRSINAKVLSLVEEYERLASLYDEDSEYYFQSLFEKEGESRIFCDMIGAPSYLKDVTVSEYVSMLRGYTANVTSVIKDVSKGDMTYSEGIWHIPVTFRKSLSYIDKDGYMFSVEDFHKTDFDMTMDVLYDEERDACLIGSITGVIASDIVFPEGRFLIVNEMKNPDSRYMKRFSTLKVNGSDVRYNDFGQAILPDGEAEVYDIDMAVIADTLNSGFNYDVVSYRFNPRKARMKLRYGYAPSGILIPTRNDLYVSTLSKSMEAGWDIGFAFPFGKKAKMGLYTGIGLSMSDLYLDLKNEISYNYRTDRYNSQAGLYENVPVNYKIKSAEEYLRYMDVFVPVYFEIEHRIGRHVLLSWDVGVKGYWSLAVQSLQPDSPYSVTYTATVADGSAQSFKDSPTSFIEANTYQQDRKWNLSAMADIGLDINLVKRKWYLMLRAGYEYGLFDMYTSGTNKYFETSTSYPVVYDPVSKTNRHVHSLISGMSLKRQGLWVSGGFKFKM